MTLSAFTPRQLELELALILRTLHTNLCFLVGEDRAAAAFDLPESQRAPEDFLPEEFPVEELPIFPVVQRLAAYVTRQQGEAASIRQDLWQVHALLYVVTPELEKFWCEAHKVFPEHVDTEVTPDIDGDPNVLAGLHYRGLIKTIAALAEARAKIDQGWPLALNEMALLVGFNERSVMSAASRNEFASEVRDGRRWVDADEALKWLLPRGYKPTLPEPMPELMPDGTPEPMVFVPVASDGTFFSPDCRIGRHYTVGPRGRERKIADYREALEALAQMPVAYWRRANASGQWGQVRESTWHRVPLRTLINDRDHAK
jgi:hypothetical protein